VKALYRRAVTWGTFAADERTQFAMAADSFVKQSPRPKKVVGLVDLEIYLSARRFRQRATVHVNNKSQSTTETLSRVLFAEGVQWKVFEHERLGRTLERTLVFSPTDGAVRRVSKYPTNWRSLDDSALFALSQQKA
jgi:hypothetical protein